MNISLKRSDLYRALASVLPAASKDAIRTGIHAVYLETGEGVLRAVATDGHWLAAAEVPAAVTEAGTCLLTLSCAEHVAKVAKPTKGQRDDSVQVNGSVTLPGVTIAIECADATFPAWRQIIPAYEEVASVVVGLSPDILAAVGRACALFRGPSDAPLSLRLGDVLSPALLECRPSKQELWLAIVMPTRL